MLFAVTGPGGSGKSTTIAYLQNTYGYKVIERKTSRSIVSDWGVTIAEINSDPELTRQFQDEILKRKIADEMEAHLSDDVWITERTTADLFVYATYSMGRLNQFSDFMYQYYEKCQAAMDRYVGIIYLRGGQFPVVNDNIRSANEHYTKMTDDSMHALTKQWAGNRVVTVTGLEGDWRYPMIIGNIDKMAFQHRFNKK